jgi:hypothetical protein
MTNRPGTLQKVIPQLSSALVRLAKGRQAIPLNASMCPSLRGNRAQNLKVQQIRIRSGSSALRASGIGRFHPVMRGPDPPLWLFCACRDSVPRRSSSFRCHTVCTLPSTSNGVSRTGYRCLTRCAHSDILGCAWSIRIPLRRTLLREQLVCRGISRYRGMSQVLRTCLLHDQLAAPSPLLTMHFGLRLVSSRPLRIGGFPVADHYLPIRI